MYNVLIVDDEEPVLDSYAHMISKREDIKLCGKARTGYEAISLVQSTHPDLVLIDIGMPGIDGLETIGELQKSYPEILYIVSTAYERFDIAKRAIPLGIFRYLVKPVSKSTFFTALDDAAAELEERRKRVISQTEKLKKVADLYLWEQKNFLSLLTWKRFQENQWREYQRQFDFTSDCASICMVSVSGFDEVPAHYRQIVSQLKYKYHVLSAQFLGRLMLFIPGEVTGEQLSRSLRDIMSRLGIGEGNYRLGIGSPQKYPQLQVSCQQALSMVDADLFDAHALETERSLLRNLRVSVQRNDDLDEVMRNLDVLSEHYLLRNTFEIARGKLIMTFTLLLEDMETLLPRQIPYDFIRDISLLKNREEWLSWSRQLLSFILERSQLYARENRPRPLNRALEFIDGRYGSPIQLADVARACEVTPSYLSRLFSDHLKSSFIDYLTSVRIQQAKVLMRTTEQSLKQISYAVGYQDPNYFSKIFRKHCGVSPSTYQKTKEEVHG